MYTTSTDDVASEATAALEELPDDIVGLSVSDTLLQLAQALERSLAPPSEDNSFLEYPSDASDVDSLIDDEESQHEPDYSDVEDEWFMDSPSATTKSTWKDDPRGPQSDALLASRLAHDLTQAKLAGFKVGYLGNRAAPIVCVSCRIAKLGISDEAMEAWQVDAQQYLVLLIRYIGRYRSFDEILQDDDRFGCPPIDIHVDLCDHYKPSYSEAINTFNQFRKMPATDGTHSESDSDSLSKTINTHNMTQSFVSKPLNTLMQERFVKILKYRRSYGFSWDGAEQFFNDFQGKSVGEEPGEKYMADEDNNGSSATTLPPLVTFDHLTDDSGPDKSFPLIAMQFVLRHFARCTEFCLVCHCKTNHAFEALKPYVCSKSLCLFQYMSLGFGPSLEWEIVSQPYVIDLLISFTYASAHEGRLADFPTGLGFLVPLRTDPSNPAAPNLPGQNTQANSKEYKARLDHGSMELVFPNNGNERPVSTGDWIVFRHPSDDSIERHCHVRDASLFPTVRLSKPVDRAISKANQGSKGRVSTPPSSDDITFSVYDTSFDKLNPHFQRNAIMMLLDTLPTVDDMKSFVSDSSKATLAGWRKRISKSALDVLRWIVASNRSCIIQEDPSRRSRDDRVYGMDGYMQFRFAQGAPDKEQRFIQSVAAAEAEKNLKHPTLFAWHGSSLGNWHGIVREGLQFRDVLHGRSCGDGVYMSPDFVVSNGFCGRYGAKGGPAIWPQGILKVSSAISLNEVVNLPQQFVYSNPFVVSQLDWIQTRYLFVRCGNQNRPFDLVASKPAEYYKQDPSCPARGPDSNPVIIPMTVFSRQRRMAMNSARESDTKDTKLTASQKKKSASSSKSTSKKRRLKDAIGWDSSRSAETEYHGNKTDGVQADGDGWASDDTESQDLEILFVAKEENKGKEKERDQRLSSSAAMGASADSSKTDYVPGTLDAAQLPLLGPPTYATPGASKALQRELKSTLQIQESHPLHELGWYIDPNLINTVYQWIVELHSFDSELPVANDLRKAGLKSIVLEIRFSKDYPISPPFVRVIQPRFLSFLQGGGGHVTAGGALCMELLTNSGWSAVANIESVLLQVRMAVSSTDPRPARLAKGQNAKNGTISKYNIGEAVQAYVRACQMHGWQVPEDFERENSMGGWGGPAAN